VTPTRRKPLMNARDLPITGAAPLTLQGAETDVAFRMDEETFRGFYDRTSRVVWAYLRRLTNDPNLADDLLQECYYRFLRAHIQLDTEAHRRHYLFKIATNLVRDGVRRTSARPAHVPHDDELSYDHNRHQDAEAVTDRMAVNEALSQLGTKERALLWLAYAQGSSHEEIAAAVGVKRSSVKSLLYRARRRMAGLLRQEGRSS
jgi:RNA polymerase sigma-70 factor (ECF subfamily)